MKDLKSILLGQDLTQTERLYLVSMAQHDGFPVLKKMFDQACKFVTDECNECNPEDSNYDQIVKFRQQRMRIVNDFCASIRKSFVANVMIGNEKEEKEKNNAGPNSRGAD